MCLDARITRFCAWTLAGNFKSRAGRNAVEWLEWAPRPIVEHSRNMICICTSTINTEEYRPNGLLRQAVDIFGRIVVSSQRREAFLCKTRLRGV